MLKDKKYVLNLIERVRKDLDWFCSPDIEEKMFCDFSCCVGNDDLPQIENMIELGEKEGIFGAESLELLRQFARELEDLIDIGYDETKGFSKTQRWFDFVGFANKVDVFLKDVLEQHKVADV